MNGHYLRWYYLLFIACGAEVHGGERAGDGRRAPRGDGHHARRLRAPVWRQAARGDAHQVRAWGSGASNSTIYSVYKPPPAVLSAPLDQVR
eukprot:478044-Prorocentrum_minimum.AAC.4